MRVNARIRAINTRKVEIRNRMVFRQRTIYENNLLRNRTAEIKRVLSICKDYPPEQYPSVIESQLNEEPYLRPLLARMAINLGGQIGAEAISDFLQKEIKGSAMWEQQLETWVYQNSGQKIVSMSGTLKKEMISWVNDALVAGSDMGIEERTRLIYGDVLEQWDNVKLWQVRRIIQTESLNSAALGQDLAMRSLGIDYVKVWSCVGRNSRKDHIAMDGIKVGKNEYFTLPNGDKMMYPHDQSMNPAAINIVNCLCGWLDMPK